DLRRERLAGEALLEDGVHRAHLGEGPLGQRIVFGDLLAGAGRISVGARPGTAPRDRSSGSLGSAVSAWSGSRAAGGRLLALRGSPALAPLGPAEELVELFVSFRPLPTGGIGHART